MWCCLLGHLVGREGAEFYMGVVAQFIPWQVALSAHPDHTLTVSGLQGPVLAR